MAQESMLYSIRIREKDRATVGENPPYRATGCDGYGFSGIRVSRELAELLDKLRESLYVAGHTGPTEITISYRAGAAGRTRSARGVGVAEESAQERVSEPEERVMRQQEEDLDKLQQSARKYFEERLGSKNEEQKNGNGGDG